MSIKILTGDCRDILAAMPTESVDCMVTSPPYWGLRSYLPNGHADKSRELGCEPTLGEHIATMVAVFDEVRRVLKPAGTLWLNYGDCYAASVNGRSAADTKAIGNDDRTFRDKPFSTVGPIYDPSRPNIIDNKHPNGTAPAGRIRPGGALKPKDLCMVPNRLAIALQEPRHLGPIKSEIDRAWLAGLIDADGCIGIRRQDNGKWNPTYIPYLTVGCSDEIILQHCVEITGLGRVNLKAEAGTQASSGIINGRDHLTWRLDGQIASTVIRDIFPYLVLKQKQAAVAHALNLSQGEPRPSRSKPLDAAIVEYRARLYDLIKALNQRQDVILPDLPPVIPNFGQGWWVRSEIIWHKPNPMPESVRDRPTSAHEKVWLLTKSERYFYDAEAIAEPASYSGLNGQDESGFKSPLRFNGKTSDFADHARTAKRGKQRGHGRRHAGFNDRWDQMERAEQCSGMRNCRNVWTIPSQPFSDAHFATFPPALVEPCVSAGCPQKVCAKCGKPWVRRVHVEQIKLSDGGFGRTHRPDHDNWDGITDRTRRSATTLGFRPSCHCKADTVPGTVLDPFGGAGTVGMVADRLGRDAILIELNPAYAAMAQSRIVNDLPLFAEVFS